MMAQQNYSTPTDAEANVPAVWKPGDVILDLYEVIGILGEGGMGTVYKVHHKNWNIDLAVKCPKPGLFTTERGQENFVREAETWVNLGLHPHTVSCYYVRTLGGIPRVFAEYVEGGSLADWIQTRQLYEGGPEQALERILDIAIQFAWGLDYAHEQGLVHQDVKPDNVMMMPDSTVKVTDFGLAKARAMAGEANAANHNRTILVSWGGMTPTYRSPEQAAGRRLSRKTDIWSWAVSMVDMFVGAIHRGVGEGAAEALASYLQMKPEDPILPAMPATLATLLTRCFQQDLADRPATMGEVATALQETYQQEIGQFYPRETPKPAEALADSLNNRAVSLFDLKKMEEAEWFWGEALRADPHHLEATYNRGVMLWRRGELTDDALIQQLEEVRLSHGENWEYKYLLGQIHLERGDIESAMPLLEEVKQQVSDETEVQATLQLAQSKKVPIGRCIKVFKETPQGRFRTGCLSVDGCFILLGNTGGQMWLWEVASKHYVRTFESNSKVKSISLSADGDRALSLSEDNLLRLWDVSTGHRVLTFGGDTQVGSLVSLSTDGRFALSWGGQWDDTPLKMWDMGSGRCLHTFEGHTGRVSSVSLSADGRFALSGGYRGLRLWDLTTGECVRIFEDHVTDNIIKLVSLSANGRWALSGIRDTLKLWDVVSGYCTRIFKGHAESVDSVKLSANGRWALSGGHDKTLRLWEVATGRCLRTFEGHTGWVTSIDLSSNGRWALSGDHRNTLRLWEIPVGSVNVCSPQLSRLRSHRALSKAEIQVAELFSKAEDALEKPHFGMALALAKKARAVPGYERTSRSMEIWERISLYCPQVRLKTVWTAKILKNTRWVLCASLSADGSWAISGSVDGTLQLWDLTTGEIIRIFKGHTHEVTSVAVSPDEDWAISGSGDRTLRLWDVATGEIIRVFEGHTRAVTSVVISPDGHFTFSGSEDTTIRVWEVETGRCLRIFAGHSSAVDSISISGDGRWVLSGGGRTLRLWEVATGRCLRVFEGHSDAVMSVNLSFDGRFALSGSLDDTIRLWNVSTGHCVRTFEGHSAEVSSVYLSTCGRWALSGGGIIGLVEDNSMRLWDVSTGRCLHIFEGHSTNVFSVCLSANGHWALSGGSDRTLRLWKLDWELEAREQADWDEDARIYLKTFLITHTPYASVHQIGHQPSEEEVMLALTRRGWPSWNEEDFQKLIRQLQYVGYGWLRPEGVRWELEKMATDREIIWKHPVTNLDQYLILMLSPDEASQGCVKPIEYLRRGPTGDIETRRLKVKIPPDVKIGTKIRLKGQGEVSEKGTSPHDLYVKIMVQKPKPGKNLE